MPASYLEKYNFNTLSSITITEKEYLNSVNAFEQWEKFRTINMDSKYLLVAVKSAIDNAGIDTNTYDTSRIGIVMGTKFGSYSSYESFYDSIHEGMFKPHEFSNSLINMPSYTSTIFFRINGPCITLSGRDIDDAFNIANILLDSGMCDIVITGYWQSKSKSIEKYYNKPCEPIVTVNIIGKKTK